jgi:DNA-binding protein Alba
MSEYEDVYIGSKPIPNYISASLWALERKSSIRLLGRGGNIKTAIDVAEILKRQIIDPKINIEIGSEEFNERKVSTITIIIEGKTKKE